MIDVVALGELLIDFAAKSEDSAGYPTMAANPGGAPGNFLAALNACGKKTAFIGNARQVHLDEGLLHAAFPAAIPLDDGSLEGYALEPRHVERDIAGGRGETAVIVTAAVALTGLAALVAGGLRQRLRLLFQQLVQRLFYTSSN